jgi:hypothetical protein
MKKVDDYRPNAIEFTAESSRVPKVLGQFESEEDARVFMSQNLLAVQTKLQAERFMDDVEIESLRNEYSEELEDVLPKLRQEHFKREEELERAKKNKKDAEEMVNASLNKIQQLANEVNERVTGIELDPTNTWVAIYDGKKYFYTFIDGEIQLAKVQDIAAYEADDLISSSEKNARFFEKLKKAVNE